MKKKLAAPRKPLSLHRETYAFPKAEKLSEVAAAVIQTGAPSWCTYCIH